MFRVLIDVTHTYTYDLDAEDEDAAKQMAIDLHTATHNALGPGVERSMPEVVNVEEVER
jgi:hypothetical protein